MPWGCFAASRIILLLLRHNIAQELLVDIHMVPQAAISPVASAYTPLISEAFQGSGCLKWKILYIIDGTFGALLAMVQASRTVTGASTTRRG
ncbi:hypothetical protein EGT56_03605 [Arachnia propionica]|nr:hypothetical protein EGT56_03605 [Arachnia propionica]